MIHGIIDKLNFKLRMSISQIKNSDLLRWAVEFNFKLNNLKKEIICFFRAQI